MGMFVCLLLLVVELVREGGKGIWRWKDQRDKILPVLGEEAVDICGRGIPVKSV